jgi:hypothetical protein
VVCEARLDDDLPCGSGGKMIQAALEAQEKAVSRDDFQELDQRRAVSIPRRAPRGDIVLSEFERHRA